MRIPGQGDPVAAPTTQAARELAALEAALRASPQDAATAFRLAQAYRAAGQSEKALKAFDHRATLAGFDQEVYIAQLHAARVATGLGHPASEVIDRYLRAYEFRPHRHEALGDLARYLREHGPRWQLAFLLTAHAIALQPSGDTFYVESEWHQWRCLDEYAVAAYWVGEYETSRLACERLLDGKDLPSGQRDRVTANFNFARQKLGLTAVDRYPA